MPIYSYRCDHCGVQFDLHQKFSDDHLKLCPECGEATLRKLYLPVGIVFKGSGFYATDHRSPSGQQALSKSEKSETSEKSTKEEKADGVKGSTEKTSSSSDLD
ncbi:MAG: FmdB family transcriptional regulator [Chloroflexi bacterium RBG_16_48_8]|nr:MAG: FmdB family transcriptional regulator [Chloroflexi bacterium RBG_16_48_8]